MQYACRKMPFIWPKAIYHNEIKPAVWHSALGRGTPGTLNQTYSHVNIWLLLAHAKPSYTVHKCMKAAVQMSMHLCSICHLTLVTCRGGLARGGSGSGTPSHAETVVGVKGKSGAKWRNQSEQLRIAMAASQGGPEVRPDHLLAQCR